MQPAWIVFSLQWTSFGLLKKSLHQCLRPNRIAHLRLGNSSSRQQNQAECDNKQNLYHFLFLPSQYDTLESREITLTPFESKRHHLTINSWLIFRDALSAGFAFFVDHCIYSFSSSSSKKLKKNRSIASILKTSWKPLDVMMVMLVSGGGLVPLNNFWKSTFDTLPLRLTLCVPKGLPVCLRDSDRGQKIYIFQDKEQRSIFRFGNKN